jgi:hypothetical protein
MASDNPNSLQTGFSKPIDNLYTLNSLVAARHDALTYGALTMRRDGTVELYRMARGSNGQVEASKSKVAIQTGHDIEERHWRQLERGTSVTRGGVLEYVRTLVIAATVGPPPAPTLAAGKRDSLGLGGGRGSSGLHDSVRAAGGDATDSRVRAEVYMKVRDVWASRYIVVNAYHKEVMEHIMNWVCADSDRLALIRQAPGEFYVDPELTPPLYKHWPTIFKNWAPGECGPGRAPRQLPPGLTAACLAAAP